MRSAIFAAAAALLAVAGPALAQQPPRIDPRLAGPTIGALQALVALRDAQMKALAEDAEKRAAELVEKCGEPCKPKDEPAAK